MTGPRSLAELHGLVSTVFETGSSHSPASGSITTPHWLSRLQIVHSVSCVSRRMYLIILHFHSRSQCINQMKELKEQCEERIEAISRKGSEIPQIKEKKNISNTSDKNDQVRVKILFSREILTQRVVNWVM